MNIIRLKRPGEYSVFKITKKRKNRILVLRKRRITKKRKNRILVSKIKGLQRKGGIGLNITKKRKNRILVSKQGC